MTGEDLKPVDDALPAVRALLDAAAEGYKIVGGLAVIHHGYARFTEDIDVLIAADARDRVVGAAASHGCSLVSPTRLRHDASGVFVDLLVAGAPMPRAPAEVYPAPSTLEPSPRDAAVVGLPGLLRLKLGARRQQDLADVVELLKLLDDRAYLDVESRVPATARPELARLRDEALDELRTEA